MRNGTWVVVMSLFFAASCESLWNRANEAALVEDVRTLLVRHDLNPGPVECEMVGTTRDGYCTFIAEEAKLQGVVAGLGLAPIQPSEILSTTSEHGCRQSASFSAPNVLLFQSQRRAPQLRLPNGGVFEYFILYQEPNTGAVCVEVSYAYG